MPEYVLKYSGARPNDRDEVDIRLINDFYSGTGKIIDSQNEVGGYPQVEPTYRKLLPRLGPIEAWLDYYTNQVMPK